MHQKIFLVVEFFKIPFRILLSPVDDFLNNSIELRNIYLKSHIQYLSESGILLFQDSSAEKKNSIIFIGMLNGKYSKKDKLFKKLIPSMFNKNYIILDPDTAYRDNNKAENLKRLTNQEAISFGSLLHGKQDIAKSQISNASSPANSHLNKDEISNEMSGPLKFVTPKFNFYMLKFFVPTDKKLTILMKV
jgi:hypothetical protein